MMWRIKRLADPAGVLGPGIVLNRDGGAHLRNLKSTPEIEASVTKCIECGFCEAVCPSQDVTVTPRQRLVLRREMARQAPDSPVLGALLDQYEYDGIETCAVDGSCQRACPVAIDTGRLIKDLRHRQHSQRAERTALAAARRYVERIARGGLRAGAAVSGLLGERAAARVPALLRERLGDELVPAWTSSTPRAAPARLPRTRRAGASAVYLPSCTNRIFGGPPGEDAALTVPEALTAISARAGLRLWIPEDVAGHCCGMPWSSKGYRDGLEHVTRETAAALARWTDGGRLPVAIDASSCTHGMLENVELGGSRCWTRSPGSTTGCSSASSCDGGWARSWFIPPARPAISACPRS